MEVKSDSKDKIYLQMDKFFPPKFKDVTTVMVNQPVKNLKDSLLCDVKLKLSDF